MPKNLQEWRAFFAEGQWREINPYRLLRPLLFRMEPEAAHKLSITILQKRLIPKSKQKDAPSLRVKIAGLDFANPVGLAAGYDKQCEVIDEILDLGFGFTELGSITPQPQPGNPQPRIFRIPEAEALINRFGFNSDGISQCRRRVVARHDATVGSRRGIVGVNLGKNKDSEDTGADYVLGVKSFAPYADYLAVNVSSPNTPGLRDLQGREQLAHLLQQVMAARDAGVQKPPVFVKIAPDLTEEQQTDIAEVVLASGVQGMIVANTTVTRPASVPPHLAQEAGGLSGRPLFGASTRLLARMYKLTEGKIPLIGCGGVFSGADAYAKIRAGASLVQVYTALVYEGPFLPRRIKRELAALLERDGFASVSEAIGADHR
ncbi:MAG: quinone-dependent dihydroorotate dehydrogenase [Alphaproteobacteria bacterium]|nr:quinone-dependent dihydroorotate dehydrogenase [Alphaproteobacteria bacterium]